MGLSSLPAPSEGVLNVILVNTALSISLFKCIVRLILHMVGIRLSWPSSVVPSTDSFESSSELGDPIFGSSWNYLDMFRNRYPRIRFDKVQSSERREHDCSVCLTQFEPESVINHLSCGHLFHTECLEKWLDYWNITCPLCRTPLMSEEEKSCFWYGYQILALLQVEHPTRYNVEIYK
ncbi:probable E3 ubiquitin-protein ligase XERICO isoform X1 [Cucumis melo]|uniref:Probable E3 ubiquitin-protein ligase XERICO isoform X1 n=1 Tax=Cucumis melo TaxID=3656 RepID=A0ABM3KUT3_CUCME|nr:probable E3 ubiquitin-protein ligase XERICO isoform X1 [Cucumis melo]